MEERSENTPKEQPKIEIITGDTTDLNISNVRDNLTFEVNKEYIIELSDDLLVKGKNPILESNFNRGKVPLDKKLHGEVEKLFGKMIVFVGYGWDNSDNDNYWNGYLPKDKIKILKLL